MTNVLWNFLNLHNGEDDKKKVLESVTANISFRGANLWILACAIIIASVGLNVNSTAVIIGAMLISPLMGPIVGAGFALGTYDFTLLKKSIKNLIIATVVGLLVSAFYFFVSPFKEVQSEMLSRTSPTIYDVLIAFFGGLVGVIAFTRVEKGNPIPGVAIATALMPPLCTAGYALATYNLSYFIGAFYLYTINCFFICIATFLVIKYLKYPAATFVERKYEKRIRYGISILILLMIIPSSYLAYNLWNEKTYSKNIEDFISEEFTKNGFTVIYKKIDYHASPKVVDIAFLNRKCSPEEVKHFNSLLKERGVSNTVLNVRQDDADLKSEILSELNKQENSVSEKDITINNLKNELARYRLNEPSLTAEIKALFPEVVNVSWGKVEVYPNTDSTKLEIVLLYSSAKEIEEQKMNDWLRQRLQDNTVQLVRIPMKPTL